MITPLFGKFGKNLTSTGFRRKNGGAKKPLVLPLTSLIDAFSIIVFYLLVATQTAGIDQSIPHDLELPKLTELELILQEEPIILKVVGQDYSIDETKVLATNLPSALRKELSRRKDAGRSTSLLIQADQKQSFEKLNPILTAASEAEVTELKFAVLPNITGRQTAEIDQPGVTRAQIKGLTQTSNSGPISGVIR